MVEGKLGKTVSSEPFLASSMEVKLMGSIIDTGLLRHAIVSPSRGDTIDCNEAFLEGITVLGETSSSLSYLVGRKLDHDRTLGSRAWVLGKSFKSAASYMVAPRIGDCD
jgi:hypothetical protein